MAKRRDAANRLDREYLFDRLTLGVSRLILRAFGKIGLTPEVAAIDASTQVPGWAVALAVGSPWS